MNEQDIIFILARSLDKRKFPFMLSNAFIYEWECDFWVLDTKGITREYEIKISLPDYKKDAAKDKHRNTAQGANYFYYVCPDGMITPDMVDKKYGLIYIGKDNIPYMVKRPTLLHKDIFTDYKRLTLKYMWKWKALWFKLYWDHKGITTEEYYNGFLTDGK